MKKHEPPEHLNSEAKAKWLEIFGIIRGRDGDVDQAVQDGITAYAVAWSQWITSTAKVNELGLVVRSAAGFATISPYAIAAAQAERRMRQWAAELRLTPKARGKALDKAKAKPGRMPRAQARRPSGRRRVAPRPRTRPTGIVDSGLPVNEEPGGVGMAGIENGAAAGLTPGPRPVE